MDLLLLGAASSTGSAVAESKAKQALPAARAREEQLVYQGLSYRHADRSLPAGKHDSKATQRRGPPDAVVHGGERPMQQTPNKSVDVPDCVRRAADREYRW